MPPEFDIDEADLADLRHEYDTDTEQEASGLTPPPSLVNVPMFPEDDSNRPNPTPRFILSSGLDATIRLWHVSSGRCIRTFFGHLEGIWALAADTLRIVSTSEDGMVKIWDANSGACERTYTGHQGPVTCVSLSGERLITGGEVSSFNYPLNLVNKPVADNDMQDCEIRIMTFSEDDDLHASSSARETGDPNA
jgi:F-box/WD-40 domain protein MET30